MKAATLARLSFVAGLTASTVAPVPAAAEGAGREPKTLRATIDAAQLHALQLQAGEGEIAIRASADDAVHVEVVVAPGRRGAEGFADRVRSWFLASRYREDADLVHATEILQEVNGGTLELDLTPDLATRKDRVHERWTIEIPARFEIGVRMDVGDASIADATGGVRARVAVGTITTWGMPGRRVVSSGSQGPTSPPAMPSRPPSAMAAPSTSRAPAMAYDRAVVRSDVNSAAARRQARRGCAAGRRRSSTA